MFQVGNAILSVAFIAAFMQGVSRLATSSGDWHQLLALSLTAAVSCVASGVVLGGAWRRVYVAYSIALVGLVFLTLNVYVDLSGWQKLEIFCTITGVALVAGGYIGRFKEPEDKSLEAVDLALGLGSVLARSRCSWQSFTIVSLELECRLLTNSPLSRLPCCC